MAKTTIGQYLLDQLYRHGLRHMFGVPELLHSGNGFSVHTIGDARQALQAALSDRKNFSIIEVDLDPYDISPALERLGQKLGKKA